MEFISFPGITPILFPPNLSIISINRIFYIISSKIYRPESLVILGLTLIYIFFYMSWARCRKSKTQDIVKQSAGCKPTVGYPQCEQILGLDLLWICTKGLRNHNLLEVVGEILRAGHNTVEYLILGNKAIITIEPENIKTILRLPIFQPGQTTILILVEIDFWS